MVTIQKGVLIQSDPALQQYIKHLDETMELGSKFIIRELDPIHLFIEKSMIASLQSRIEGFLDSLAPES